MRALKACSEDVLIVRLRIDAYGTSSISRPPTISTLDYQLLLGLWPRPGSLAFFTMGHDRPILAT